MNTSLFLLLVAPMLCICALVLYYDHTPAPDAPALTCLSVQQHVNSVYERSYRGETELTRDAVRELQWLERSLCAQEEVSAH